MHVITYKFVYEEVAEYIFLHSKINWYIMGRCHCTFLRAKKPPCPLQQLPLLTFKGMNFDHGFQQIPPTSSALFPLQQPSSGPLLIMPGSHMWLQRRMRFILFFSARGSPWQRHSKHKQMCVENRGRKNVFKQMFDLLIDIYEGYRTLQASLRSCSKHMLGFRHL